MNEKGYSLSDIEIGDRVVIVDDSLDKYEDVTAGFSYLVDRVVPNCTFSGGEWVEIVDDIGELNSIRVKDISTVIRGGEDPLMTRHEEEFVSHCREQILQALSPCEDMSQPAVCSRTSGRDWDKAAIWFRALDSLRCSNDQ